MASDKCNFIIVGLIVFYTIMNFDCANCHISQEDINFCLHHMTQYCGEDNLHTVLGCAKNAITEAHGGHERFGGVTVGARGTPSYILKYFEKYVTPFIAGFKSFDDFCESEEIYRNEEITAHFAYLFGLHFFTIDEVRTTIKNSCRIRLQFLTDKTIQDIFIKEDMHNFEVNDYHKKEAYMYLQAYLSFLSEIITFKENEDAVEKIPFDYCHTIDDEDLDEYHAIRRYKED